jgi:hypothetical protein
MSAIHGVNYGTPTLDLNFSKNKSLIDTVTGRNLVTFTRASTGTYVGADGLIKTAAANEARFDHNPATGESLGLLVEEARTNLTPNSMPTTAGGSGGGLTNTLVTDLPGIFSTGRRLTSAGGNDVRIAIEGTFVLSDTVTYAFSFFARLGTQGNSIFVRRGTGSFTTWNLSTGTVTRNDFGTAQIVNYGNGWYKCSVAMLGTSGGSFLMGLGNDLNAASGDNLIIAGVQTEAGSFPTSYIPTTTATVTRAADVASITGTNFTSWYRQDEGTFCGKGRQTYTTPNQFESLIVVGGYPNRSWSWAIIGGNNIWSVGTDGLDTGSFYTGLTPNVPFSFNVAQAQKSNQSVAVADGVIKASNTPSQILYTNASGLSIGSNYDGHISRLSYYPSRLQDSQLQQITK